MKKIISCILVIVMAISIFGALPAKAENSVSKPEPQVKTDISVEGTDSFGNLLTSELSKEVDRQEENNGCNIFSIEMNGADATVSFETTEDCTLVVAVYDESGEQMFASGNVAVVKGETEKTVTIETENMPQFYFLRGFLVDSDTFRPVCTSYESPNYTQEMQEFFAKTVNDFDSEKVLNLDASESNNFVVFSNETIIIEQNGTTNCVTKADDNTRTYVITNADDMVKSLKNGDIFTCKNGNETLIVKVDKISVVGSTVTITGQETSMEEVFEYVKIDTEQYSMVEDVETLQNQYLSNYSYSYADETQKLFGKTIAADKKVSCTRSIEFSTPEISQYLSVGVKGGMETTVSAAIKLHYNFRPFKEDYLYTELKIEYESKIYAAIEGTAKLPIDLGEFNLPCFYGINIGVAVTVEIGVTGETEINGTIKGSIGFSYDSDEDMVKNTSSTPEYNSEIKSAIGVFFAVAVKPNINFINDDFADIELELKNEIEFKGEKVWWELKPDTNKKHMCENCIDGEINRKVATFFNVKIMDKKIFNNKLYEIAEKWCDFYYSFDHDEFGFGTCPYELYRVTINVQDENGQAVNGAEITFGGLATNVLGTTDENGRLEVWLSNGDYILTAEKGNVTTTRGITVHDNGKSIAINLGIEVENLNIDFNELYEGSLEKDGCTYYYTMSYIMSFNGNGTLFTVSTDNSDGIKGGFELPITKMEKGVYYYENGSSYNRSITGGRINIISDLSGTITINNDNSLLWKTEDSLPYELLLIPKKDEIEASAIKLGAISTLSDYPIKSYSLTPQITYLSNEPTLQTKDFTDLLPNEIYNFYIIKSTDENPLSGDNLLYVKQVESDTGGNLEIPYIAKEQCENAIAFVKAISKTDLSSAQVTIPDILCNGTEQFAEPEVILNDLSLVEGIDYDIEKRYSATYPGEYELVITGIRNYTGEVTATYKICCEHKFENGRCITCKSLNDTIGDANGDGVVGVADLVVLQDFLAAKRKDISVHADVNQDGVINVFDLSILREIVSSVLS